MKVMENRPRNSRSKNPLGEVIEVTPANPGWEVVDRKDPEIRRPVIGWIWYRHPDGYTFGDPATIDDPQSAMAEPLSETAGPGDDWILIHNASDQK
jgi:hypothetical protein